MVPKVGNEVHGQGTDFAVTSVTIRCCGACGENGQSAPLCAPCQIHSRDEVDLAHACRGRGSVILRGFVSRHVLDGLQQRL